ncbi:MAG: hypothetical protein FOGNACKC_00883 [Anaerolineae bacterium]|nr:hypothetical protein [Anaerolineae bacterium]
MKKVGSMADLKVINARCVYMMHRDGEVIHLMDRQRPTQKSVTLCGLECGYRRDWEALRDGDVLHIAELCPDCLTGFAGLGVVDERRAALISGLDAPLGQALANAEAESQKWLEMVRDLAAGGFLVDAQAMRLEFSYAVGLIKPGATFSRDDGELDWWLDHIEVDRPYRGRGEGTRFMEALLEVMGRRGERLGLFCEPVGQQPPMSQSQLQRWYYRLGFKQSGGEWRMVWRPE